MDNSFHVDLKKKENLYTFSSEELLEINVPFGSQTYEWLKQGSCLMVPLAESEPNAIEEILSNDLERKKLLMEIYTDQKPDSLSAMLNFPGEIIPTIESLDVEEEKAENSEGEIESEETITLSLEENAASDLTEFEAQIKLFSGIPKESGSMGLNSTDEPEEPDLITEAIYLDENDQEIYREILIPKKVEEISESGIILKINKKALPQEGGNGILGGIKKIFKKIKIIVKKVVGKIKKLLKKLKNETIDFIIEKIINSNIFPDRYKILKYNFVEKDFEEVNSIDIEPSKKTLLLLHGTLKGSFDGLFKNENKKKGSFMHLYNEPMGTHKNWFDYFASDDKGKAFEQILCFEHETVFHGPKENVEMFIQKWGLDQIQFEKPLSIIAASRGSLLAKYLSVSKLAPNFSIDRVAVVSGGYSNYFKNETGVQNYLDVIFRLFGLNLPLRFLQSLSIDIIFRLPGLLVQNPDGNKFKQLIETPNNVIYFNYANDASKKNGQKSAFEKLADSYLGEANDLALSWDAQIDFRPGFQHSLFPPYESDKAHGKALEEKEAKEELLKFLTHSFSPLL